VLQVRWRVDRSTGQVQRLPPSVFPFESDDPALGDRALDFLDTGKKRYQEAFFPDGLFDGSRYTLDFDLRYDAPHPDAAVVIQRAFAVVLLSVTEDFYRYWRTAGEQALTNENPFAEPLRVHSNLTGALGVMAGFQYRLLPLAAGEAGGALDSLCTVVGGRLPLCGPGNLRTGR
jgi:hypothetical protein